MTIVAFLSPFVLLGAIVLFVAFSGGPGRAREAYLTKGSGVFKVLFPLAVIVFGFVVPGLVVANRGQAQGGVGALRDAPLTKNEKLGKQLFRSRCSSCHTLAAVDARGITGPNLDRIGAVTQKRVLNAIRIGGTGDKRMPPGLLSGPDAQHVAQYLSKVAGH